MLRDMATRLERKRRLGVHIRWMIRDDMDAVLSIERDSFPDPWVVDDFVRCLRQRNGIGIVAVHGEEMSRDPWSQRQDYSRIVGFMVYELRQSSIDVLNFAVDPDLRRLGIGRLMVDELTGKLSAQRRNRIELNVWEENLAAQLFFRAVGFRARKIIKNLYQKTNGDAYRFVLMVCAGK